MAYVRSLEVAEWLLGAGASAECWAKLVRTSRRPGEVSCTGGQGLRSLQRSMGWSQEAR